MNSALLVPAHWLVKDSAAFSMARRSRTPSDASSPRAFWLAAVEAMALGKPVVGYIMPTLRKELPSDLPIVDATRENLSEVLAPLVAHGHRRARLGRLGRAFVQRHHNAVTIAGELVEHYKELCNTSSK